MADPIYISQARGPRAELNTSPGVSPPDIGASGAAGANQAKLGQAISEFGEMLYKAQSETQAATASTEYIKRENDLRRKWTESNDYENASREYRREHAELETDVLGRIADPKLRETTRTSIARRFVEGDKEVFNSATKSMVDIGGASLKVRYDDAVNRAAGAASEVERATIINEFGADVDRQTSAGIISAVGAVKYKQTFGQSLNRLDLARQISSDPAGAITKLDEGAYPSIDPVERQAYREQAQAAFDERERLRSGELAMRDPALAAARTSRLTDVGHVDQIYDRVIIPKESGGRADAISEAGALGLGQLMPDTARAQAARMGLDLSEMSDAELRRKLLDRNDPLNYTVGKGYWRFLLERYNGNPLAAAGAYFAGEGAKGMDPWHQAAVAQFGDHYSASQLASVIPAGHPKTRAYVLDAARRMGLEPGAPGPSFKGSYLAAQTVDAELASQGKQRNKNLTDLIALQKDERDAIITSFKKGYATDPQAIAAIEAPLIAAAAAGDTAAAVKWREIRDLRELAPLVEQAYQARPEALVAALAQLEAQAVRGGAGAKDLQRIEVIKGVLQEVDKARKDNPVALQERREGQGSVVQLPAIDDPALGDALLRRSGQAERALAFFGGELKILKPDEAETAKAQFADMQPVAKAALFTSIAGALPEKSYRALVQQVAGNDAVAAAAGILGRRDHLLARDILVGQAYMQEKGSGTKLAEVREALKVTLPSNVYPPEVAGDMIEAALALYAGDRGKSGQLFDPADRAGLEKAIARVAGRMSKVNGSFTPIPEGAETQLKSGMRALNQATVDYYGGAIGSDGRPLEPGFLARNGRLKPMAPGGGTYAVYVVGGDGQELPVMTRSLTPFTLDMAAFEMANRAKATRKNVENAAGIAARSNFARRGGAAADALQAEMAADDGAGTYQRITPSLRELVRRMQRDSNIGGQGPAPTGVQGEPLLDIDAAFAQIMENTPSLRELVARMQRDSKIGGGR